MKPKNLYYILAFSVVIFLAAFVIEKQLYRKELNYDRYSLNAQKNLQKEEQRIGFFLNDVYLKIKNETGWSRNANASLNAITTDISGFSLFVFYKDSLRYWSDNSALISNTEVKNIGNQQAIQLKNGWYEIFKKPAGDKLIVALLLIKHEYAIENEYLVNDFNEVLQLPEHAQISQIKSERIFPVKSATGNLLFSLSFNNVDSVSSEYVWLGLLYLLSIFSFLLFCYLFIRHIFKHNPVYALLLIFAVVGLRILTILYHFPEAIYNLPLFSPKYYASSLMLNSLGDLLISSVIFCFIIISLYYYYEEKSERMQQHNKIKTSLRVIFIWLFTFIFSVLINYLLSSLILNSKISFNINNVFELTGYSIIGFLVIGILLFSFYLVCDGGIRFISKTHFTLLHIAILFLLTQGLFLIILLSYRTTELFEDYGVSAFLLANLLIIFIGFVRKTSGRGFSFTGYILFILAFSAYAAQTIFEFNKIRERDSRIAIASKLENEQDIIAEYLFEDIANKVRADKYIVSDLSAAYRNLLSASATGEMLERRLMRQYFNGYWEKYDIRIKSFNPDGLPINTGGDPTWSLDYFQQQIESSGKPTYSPNLYYTSSESGRISYIGRITVPFPEMADSIAGTIMLELSAKFLKDDSGYPDLLLSNKIPLKRDLSNYSYAKYQNGMLVNQFGKYSYNLLSVYYEKYYNRNVQEQFANFDGRSHLFYKSGKDGLIIISTITPGPLELVTLFSYIFSFFCLIFIAIYVIVRLTRTYYRFSFAFKNRIQVTVISIVVTAMLLIGASTIYYIMTNYSNNQILRLRERLNSIVFALSKDLSDEKKLGGNVSDELSNKFANLYSVLNVEFNIYNTAGYLIYSTQPKLFEQDIAARTMNRVAFQEFNVGLRSNYVNFEKIGTLGFLTGYAAVRNSGNVTIGYLNLPYFAKQSELKKEISSFLVALINIYVLLFAFSVGVTFIISTRITHPLKIIQERMSKVKLGIRNEQIEWKGKDEIGDLVTEYNRMIDEMSNSARKLAKSERESAWREMAKQVAHEIKNPLTPMKLSVQHLQRAYRDKSVNLDEIMQRFSHTLVEQIDTLSSIATEFSNFAQMPKANFEVLDLTAIVKSIVDLYRETEKVKVYFNDKINGSCDVYADREQMLRVFTNLVKNAMQAIPEEREGVVEVKLHSENEKYVVAVKDNGQGISAERVQKIFTPNFTTKTGGTGLGLAMVKNIVENSNGEIWFETIENTGTTFFVALPKYTET